MKDKILYELQKDFPLTKRPFYKIAKRVGIDEEKVIKIVKDAKQRSIIRQTSAIYDTKKLGYRSSLVAFKIDNQKIDEAVKILNSHPGISHNYERDHEFNIWFTLAVPPDSKLGLEGSVELLAKLTKAKEYIILPTKKLFKISVKLNTSKDADREKKEQIKKRVYKDIALTELHKRIIKYTQEDIDIVKEPFLNIVKKLDIDYDNFFKLLNELKAGGYLRRFAAILNHRKVGFNANAMVVWDIDDDKALEAGEKLASFEAVSHCYLRPRYKNWPYNLFTMVHGTNKEETNSIVNSMQQEVDYNSNRYLYSTREFKKVRIKYFTDDIAFWENKIYEKREDHQLSIDYRDF